MLASEGNGLLFDVSPDERDGQEKRKSKKRAKPTDAVPVKVLHGEVADKGIPYEVDSIGEVDGHYQCGTCGISLLDITGIRVVDGKKLWKVTCSWWCMHSWLVEPIPGVLDESDRREAKRQEFIVKGGIVDGMTFHEIEAKLGRKMIERIAANKDRKFLASKAAEWLSENPLTATEVRIQ